MSVMSLTHLPTEILEQIVQDTLPEGFEGIALTCKRIHAVCIPFLQQHNELRSLFRNFTFSHGQRQWKQGFESTFDLISRIATEPIAARYINHIDLGTNRYPEDKTSFDGHAAVLKLFANSPYLEQAGLDWQEFYQEIKKDFNYCRYSQHAAAFLLTLLPNVKTLVLPKEWKSYYPKTDQLISELVRKANESNPPTEASSLLQVAEIELFLNIGSRCSYESVLLGPLSNFLTLPQLRCFRGQRCIALGDKYHGKFTPFPLNGSMGVALTSIIFKACYLDDVAVAHILQNTKLLRKFQYSHGPTCHTERLPWSISKFIAAVEREVGTHLEELSLSMDGYRVALLRDKPASLRGFLQLQKLELPLEIVSCLPVPEGRSLSECYSPNDEEPFIGNFVPKSVSQFSLLLLGSYHPDPTLDFTFNRLLSWEKSPLPALKEITFTSQRGMHSDYHVRYLRLLAQTKKTGILWNSRAVSERRDLSHGHLCKLVSPPPYKFPQML